ncbi:MAG: flagellar hook-basal body complex protein, partial [Desulfobulbaceae bacterium]|nr:flagellar hook-basal body complex protein [Desulfobulbaceae bacterium]
MAISSSLYSSISGLSTMGEAMSVLGDNVANVNTISFKSSRATFQDVLSQSVSTAAGSAQVGRGVTLSTVDGLFAQGSFESSSTATDMAIGGDGFFMLRGADSAEADMYSRAGEFRFDQAGDLVNPSGYFVQGWSIDENTGDRQGTISDINIGKTTPPVESEDIQIIFNLDSREQNETTETRLFDSWNGTNAAAVSPSDPIAATAYEYTSAIKVYDSQGASHDITVYFDRTTNDNEWEFLATCEPAEDMRNLSTAEQTVYAPDETYNYENHKGAGALMYGTINYNTSGEITRINCWDVPPDGKVDPALNDNRKVLATGTSYYSFECNFTGATTDQTVNLNFGAQYSGQTTNQTQIIVSDGGGYADAAGTNYITEETLWNSVYDSGGNVMKQGDTFIFSGYSHDGTVAPTLVYEVDDSTKKVSDLLTSLEATFGCSADIDAYGRLKLTDNSGGDSGLAVTYFNTVSADDAVPFGGSETVSGNWFRTLGATYNQTGSVLNTSTTVELDDLEDAAAVAIAPADAFNFSGIDVDGVAVVATNIPVVANITTVQDLLTFIETTFEGATPGTVTASLDSDGRIRIIDETAGGNLAVNAWFSNALCSPFGLPAAAAALTALDSLGGQINITTSKRMVYSEGRGLSTSTGLVPVITANTQWSSVYNNSGAQVSNNDIFTISGSKGDGTPVTAGNTYTVDTTNTVQDFLDWMENLFDCEAEIDNNGRLLLTDRVADTVALPRVMAITGIVYTIDANNVALWGPAATSWDYIPADISGEDGSREGDVISANFENEALSSTQYANSSTTIYQDQDGYASGFLQSVSVDTDGVITGHYSNGQVIKKAQVSLATFNSLHGLYKKGGNIFEETTESGAPITGAPQTNGLGSIAPNALEMSNVDLGTEFVKLITVQRGFQANSK